MTKFFIAAVLSIGSLIAVPRLQARQSDCKAEQIIGRNLAASRFETGALGCVVSVTPLSKPELRYRDYWIDDRGRLLVFTSTPGDDLDKITGTRTYFLFPRQGIPSFRTLEDGTLSLRLGNGQDVVFSADARVQSFPGKFSEDQSVNLENNGGLELSSFEGILLDAGWKTGSEAYKDPKRSSTLSDSHNRTCKIQNDEFFLYESMYYGDPEPKLRFPDDKSLVEFLQVRCPNLDVSSLLPSI